MMYAAASGNTETVKVLIENGANGSVLDQHLCGLGVASSRFMTRPARLLRHNPAPAPAVLGEGLQVGFPLDQHSCGFGLAVPVCRLGGLQAPKSSNGSGWDAGAWRCPNCVDAVKLVVVVGRGLPHLHHISSASCPQDQQQKQRRHHRAEGPGDGVHGAGKVGSGQGKNGFQLSKETEWKHPIHPKGSKYPISRDSDPKSQTLNVFWDQKP